MILSIDPGPLLSAYVELDPKGFKIESFGKVSNEVVLQMVRTCQRQGSHSLLAVETIQSFGMSVGEEVFSTCIFVGRLWEAFRSPVRLVKRTEVKMHICRDPRARDGNIRQALIDRFGPPGTKKEPGKLYGISGDCWSALAIGLTALETPLPPAQPGRSIEPWRSSLTGTKPITG